MNVRWCLRSGSWIGKDNSRIPNNRIGAVFAIVLYNESDLIASRYVEV